MADKKLEETGTAEKKEEVQNVEQTIWTIRADQQILYKEFVEGRISSNNMSLEKNEKIKKISSKAIAELSAVLNNKTIKPEATEEEEETVAEKPIAAPKSTVTRGAGGKFVSKSALKETVEKDEKKSSGSSFFKKLIS